VIWRGESRKSNIVRGESQRNFFQRGNTEVAYFAGGKHYFTQKTILAKNFHYLFHRSGTNILNPDTTDMKSNLKLSQQKRKVKN
jgi:hypothetical protein